MEPPGGRDSRFNLGYSMNLLSGETPPEIYGGSLGRPSTSLQLSPRHTMVPSACGTRGGLKSDCYDDRGLTSQQSMGLEACGVNEMNDEPYNSIQSKKSPPSNGKKTKGRVKIKMEYIENKLRRYTTFSKRKTGIMKKAFELSTLTGTQVMLMVASETGHVYTFATRKLQPMITSEAGKALIQTCLNSPDPPAGSSGADQRMSATGFEETELTYNVSDEDSKEYEDCDASTSDENDDDDEELPEYVDVQVLENISNNGTSINKTTNSLNDNLSSSLRNLQSQKQPNSDKAAHLPKKVPKIEKSKDSPEPAIIKQLKKINETVALSNALKQSSQIVKTSKSSQPPRSKSASPLDQNIQTSKASSTTPSNTQPPLVIQASSDLQSLILPQPLNIQVHEPTAAYSSNTQSNSQAVLQLSEKTQISSQIPNGATIVPLLIQTPNGLGFASVSDGMILGRVQNSTDNKLVIIPLSSVTGPMKTEKPDK